MRAKYTHRTNLTVRTLCISPRGAAPSGAGDTGTGGKTYMRRASYIRHEKLPDLMGRINYISSGEEQEHLYAVYQTQPEEYWRELAKENRDSFFRSGTSGTCIEAREFIIALPEAYYKNGWDPYKVLHHFVESFKKEYGAECIAALHHNHDMNNYHIHLIYSEREKLDEPVIKIATRNMYFDPDGRHLRTKKEATVDGELMPGYTMVHKGEVYEQHLFDKKSPVFKQKNFTAQVKRFFTDLMNQPLRDDPRCCLVMKSMIPFYILLSMVRLSMIEWI